MIYGLTILFGFLGLFGHWLTRYKQSRTTSSFKEYLMGDWVSSMQSLLAILASSISIAASMPGTGMAIVAAYTAGYMFDSTLNRDVKFEIPNQVKKSVQAILDDDNNL